VEEKGRPVAELLGQHRYQLDAKGRIALPQRYRDEFAAGVYLTLGQDGCLFAYPGEEWSRRSREVRSAPIGGKEGRNYARMFFGNAERADLDGQGRLVIPQSLRSRAGLAKEVVVLGVGERLEIWEAGVWDREEQALIGAYVAGTLRPDAS
jgi:MraZ protein